MDNKWLMKRSCKLPWWWRIPWRRWSSHNPFVVVQSGGRQAIMRNLGGGNELVSSGDEFEDKLDHERFAQKYQEVHRLMRAPGGPVVLYIGAENWPFSIPIASKRGKWYFESDAGAQEILFRRVGENEATVMETCHARVFASKQDESNATSDDAIARYARTLVRSHPANGRSSHTNEEQISALFHGYYFRMLTGRREGKDASNSTTGGFLFVAYPANYRLSGVMTFVVTQDGTVYEKDLGPNTTTLAEAMTARKPGPRWHTAE
jgi:hypothetical protein